MVAYSAVKVTSRLRAGVLILVFMHTMWCGKSVAAILLFVCLSVTTSRSFSLTKGSFHLPITQCLATVSPTALSATCLLLLFLLVGSSKLPSCLSSIDKVFLFVFVLLNVSFLEIGTTVHFKQKGMVPVYKYLLDFSQDSTANIVWSYVLEFDIAS